MAVFTPRFSGWIIGLYGAILVFLGVILLGIPLFVEMDALTRSIFVSTFLLVTLVIVIVLYRAKTMKFTVEKGQLTIRGIFTTHRLKLSDIKSAEKTPALFGIRLMGASFLGGLYHLPGIGKTWVAMGNFDDGVLLRTKKNRHFFITPQNPMQFIKIVKGR